MPLADAIRTELWLVRHGESTGNRDGIVQGHVDLPLTPLGQRQVELLADRLRGLSFSAIACSDLIRARQTAQPIAAALGLAASFNPQLREIDTGGWSGLTLEQIQQRFPEEWTRWQSRDPELCRGGGESYTAAATRISDALGLLAREHSGGRVLVICHGTVIRLFLAKTLNLGLVNAWRLDVANASICRVRPGMIAAGSTILAPGQITAVNDIAHLEEAKVAVTA